MIRSVEEGYKTYLDECSGRKKWMKKNQATWYKRFLFFFLQRQVDNGRWIAQLSAMERVLNLSEEEKKIFN